MGDYVVVAMWDRFLFKVARHVAERKSITRLDDGENKTASETQQTVLDDKENTLDKAMNNSETLVFFLQEAQSLKKRKDWLKIGNDTALFVHKNITDEKRTEEATAALQEIMKSFEV